MSLSNLIQRYIEAWNQPDAELASVIDSEQRLGYRWAADGAGVKQNGVAGSYGFEVWPPIVDTFRTVLICPPPMIPAAFQQIQALRALRSPPWILQRNSTPVLRHGIIAGCPATVQKRW